MGKIQKIAVDSSRKDQGTLPLNIAVAPKTSLHAGDTLEIAVNQELVEKTATINNVERRFRAVPCHLNGEVIEISANSLFGTRYVKDIEVAEHVEADLYRMEWQKFYAASTLRFPSIAGVAKVVTNDDKSFVQITADAAVTLQNVGDVLVYDFKATLDDTTTIVNKQGREVRRYVYLKRVSDYIAE